MEDGKDYYCSLCGYETPESQRTKKCPECGAVMDDWEDAIDILSIFEEDFDNE